MAILWADGFDTYNGNSSKMLAYTSAPSLTKEWANTGTYSAYIGTYTVLQRVFDGTSKSVVGISCRMKFTNYPDAGTEGFIFFHLLDANGGDQLTARLMHDGKIHVYLGYRYTEIGVADDVLNPGDYHIETWCKVANAGGWVEIRVDGVTVINVADIKTKNTSISGAYYFNAAGTWYDNYHYDLDDLIALDDSGAINNSFIGPGKHVIEDVCDSDVAATGYTPTSGTSVSAMLDDIPEDGDTSVVTSTASGDNFEVGFPALDDTVNNFLGVIFSHVSKKSDAGDATMTISSVSGSSVSSGSANALATGYNVYNAVFEVDPATNAPWTNAAAQAATARFTHGA